MSSCFTIKYSNEKNSITIHYRNGIDHSWVHPKYYSPNTQNVPLISEEDESSLTIEGNGNQAGIQAAYGISNNIAVKGEGGLFFPADQDNGNGGSGQFIDFGLGYINKVSDNWVFETYGIVGFGSMENHLPSTIVDNPNTEGDISASLLRVGVQPNFGYKSELFDAAISSRIVNISYSGIEGDLMFDGENQVRYLEDNSSNLMIEPALTLRAGVENYKLQLQVGYSMNVSNSDFRQDNGFLTLGLNVNIK